MGSDCSDMNKVKGCSLCGKCSSGCEVNRLDPSFQPHRLLHLISTGALDRLLNGDAIWKCTTCFTCSERCPQGIRITDIIWSIRDLSVRAGHIPEMVAAQKEALLKTGRLYPVSALDNKKREKAGLPAQVEESPVVGLIFEAVKADEKEL